MSVNISPSALTEAQNRVFYYRQGLKSDEFNRIFSKTFPPGIYEYQDYQGEGLFEYINATNFTIFPFSVVIKDGTGKDIAVRVNVTTSLSAEINADLEYPLVVARFEWAEGSESFLDILQVSENVGSETLELHEHDIILGKLNLLDDGGTVILDQSSPFDYTRQTLSPLLNEVLQPRFMVRSPRSYEDQNKVYIEGGIIRTKNGVVEISGGLSPAISNTSFNRTDYIYIDENGEIKVEEGDSSGNAKPYFGRKVLAEIYRESGRTDIKGKDIFQLHNEPFGTLQADIFLTNNSENYYSGSQVTIEEALKQVWEKAIRSVFDENDPNESTRKIFRHSQGTRFERDNVKDSIVLRGRDGGTQGRQVTITPSSLSSSRTLTLADANTTLTAGTMVTTASIDQTLSGEKTFTVIPKIPTGNPTENSHVVSKNYFDATGVKISGSQTIEGTKLFRDSNGTDFQYASNTDKIRILGLNAGSESNVLTITTAEALSEGRTITFPDGNISFLSGTPVTTHNFNQTIEGHKTFRNSSGITLERSSSTGKLKLIPTSQATGNAYTIQSPSSLGGNRTLSLADANTTLTAGTMTSLENTQILTGEKTFRNPNGTRFHRGDTKDSIVIQSRDTGTQNRKLTISTHHALQKDISVEFPGDDNVTIYSGEQVTCGNRNQTLEGIKTFSAIPRVPNNTSVSDGAVRKSYVDSVSTSLESHINDESTENESVHGIQQGSNNGFDADKLDGAHLNTSTSLGERDDLIPSQNAVKVYADGKLSLGGGTLTGSLTTRNLAPSASGYDIGTSSTKYKDAYFSGTVHSHNFNGTSSRKKKDHINTYTGKGIDIINKLEIVTFVFKEDEDQREHIGIIAEDSPWQILSTDQKALSLTDSIGILFKSVQELSAKVRELEKKIED